jgi:3-oxoacyl-[acyl-carrier protein] reductase
LAVHRLQGSHIIPYDPSEPRYSGSKGGQRSSASTVAPKAQPDPLTTADLRGHVALVTGGATGLGRAIVLEFARRGVHVAFNYLDLPERDIGAQALMTETAVKGFGVNVFCEPCDVRSRQQVQHFVTTAKAELGGIHYLVNNAGIAHDGALWRITEEAWREVMDTNAMGPFNCISAVAPEMRAQHFGKIVNVASHQAFTPGFGVANYAASKAAVIGLTRSAAVDLGASNINVNAVAPGFVRTEMLGTLPADVLERAEHRAALGRMAEPEDVAHVVLFLCSEESRHITGQVIVVDGGLTIA